MKKSKGFSPGIIDEEKFKFFGGENSAYFPRAKHSRVTVDPFAAGTLSGKLTSIFGSYSPITPTKSKCKNLSLSFFMHHKLYDWYCDQTMTPYDQQSRNKKNTQANTLS